MRLLGLILLGVLFGLLVVLLVGCSFSDDDSRVVDLPTEPPMPVMIQPAGLCVVPSAGLAIQCSDESTCREGLQVITCDSVVWERFDSSGVFVDSLTGGPGERVQFAAEPGAYRVQQTISARDANPVALQHNVTVSGG